MDHRDDSNAEVEYGPESWISMTDVFLIAFIAFVLLFLSLEAYAQSQQVTIDAKEERIRELDVTLGGLAERLRVLMHQVNGLSKSVDGQQKNIRQHGEKLDKHADDIEQHAVQIKDVETHKVRLAQHTEDIQTLKATDVTHANQVKALGDSHDKHREEMAAHKKQTDSDLTQLRELRLDELADVVKTDRGHVVDLQSRVAVLERQLDATELLGLKGECERVVFVFDRSGSMEPRWNETIDVLSTWLRYMPVSECALVTFNEYISTYPAQGMLDLSGKDSAEKRTEMIDWLKKKKPDGFTNTLGALQKAYEYEQTTMIVLFTDGAPRTAATPKDKENELMDQAMAKQIEKLVRLEKNNAIPLNTVGLGIFYEDKKFYEFLKGLSTTTKGAFLAK